MKVYIVIETIGGVVDSVDVYAHSMTADRAEARAKKEYCSVDNDVYQFVCEVIE